MAYETCIAEVTKAVGRDLTDDEIDRIFSGVERRAKRLLREQAGISADEAYRRAAEEFGSEAKVAAIISKRNAAMAMMRRAEAVDFVQKQFGERPGLGLESLMVGTNRARQGGRMSAAAEQASLAGYFTRGFLADVQKLGKSDWKLFISGTLDREIARELWEFERPGGKVGITGSDEALRLAKLVSKWQDAARVEANKAGAWIRKTPGYIVRQSHDMFKIRAAGYGKWRDTILPLLDERTFDDVEDREAFLHGAFDGLSSGVHLSSPGDGLPSGIRRGQNVARAMSQDRLLHFRSADAWFDYNAKFGSGNLRESFLFGLQRMAKDTGLMRVFGPNPRDTYDRVFDELIRQTKGRPEARTKLSSDRSWLDTRFAEIDGSTSIPGNVMIAKYSAAVRAWQSMSKLGFSMISGFSDIGLAASELNYQGINFLSATAKAISALGPKSEGEREILGAIGIMSDVLRSTATGRISAEDTVPGAISGALRTFFKWNGLSWWTDSLRDGVALAMSNRLAKNVGLGWSALDADLKRTLGLFGLDGEKWELLRRVGAREADGQSFMVPEAAREIADADIAAVLQGRGQQATKAAVARYRDEIESQLRAYFVDRVEYAVIAPDARTNAILRRGTQPGTVEGEIFRFAGQFKAFPAAVIQKALGREVYGRGSDTFLQALRNGNGEMWGLAKIIVSTTVLGYVSMAVKDLLRGKEPRNPLSKATIMAAAAQGGGLGVYGDFLFGEANRFGQSPVETLAGPTAGTVTDLYDLYTRARDGQDLAAQSLRFLIAHTPYANLFYIKAALDYMIVYQVQEALNPGYLQRMQRKMEREQGQRFLISPAAADYRRGGR